MSAALADSAAVPPNGTEIGTAPDEPPQTGDTVSERWGEPHIAASELPEVYVQEWERAANRDSCALIAPATLGTDQPVAPRRAVFSGGWAVAYDLPGQRSAFGVAGSGLGLEGAIYDAWPHRKEWPDGSVAEYGPEGGQGPNQIAYLRVQGEGCLYNVWSRLGRSHLEFLLAQLRRVEH